MPKAYQQGEACSLTGMIDKAGDSYRVVVPPLQVGNAMTQLAFLTYLLSPNKKAAFDQAARICYHSSKTGWVDTHLIRAKAPLQWGFSISLHCITLIPPSLTIFKIKKAGPSASLVLLNCLSEFYQFCRQFKK